MTFIPRSCFYKQRIKVFTLASFLAISLFFILLHYSSPPSRIYKNLGSFEKSIDFDLSLNFHWPCTYLDCTKAIAAWGTRKRNDKLRYLLDHTQKLNIVTLGGSSSTGVTLFAGPNAVFSALLGATIADASQGRIEVSLQNGAVSGSGSNFFAGCMDEWFDLEKLARQAPTLVFLEFATNDQLYQRLMTDYSTDAGAPIERILTRLSQFDSLFPVITSFGRQKNFITPSGEINCFNEHTFHDTVITPLAKKYGVPHINWVNSICHHMIELEQQHSEAASRFLHKIVSKDLAHPNSLAHKQMASMISYFLDNNSYFFGDTPLEEFPPYEDIKCHSGQARLWQESDKNPLQKFIVDNSKDATFVVVDILLNKTDEFLIYVHLPNQNSFTKFRFPDTRMNEVAEIGLAYYSDPMLEGSIDIEFEGKLGKRNMKTGSYPEHKLHWLAWIECPKGADQNILAFTLTNTSNDVPFYLQAILIKYGKKKHQ